MLFVTIIIVAVAILIAVYLEHRRTMCALLSQKTIDACASSLNKKNLPYHIKYDMYKYCERWLAFRMHNTSASPEEILRQFHKMIEEKRLGRAAHIHIDEFDDECIVYDDNNSIRWVYGSPILH